MSNYVKPPKDLLGMAELSLDTAKRLLEFENHGLYAEVIVERLYRAVMLSLKHLAFENGIWYDQDIIPRKLLAVLKHEDIIVDIPGMQTALNIFTLWSYQKSTDRSQFMFDRELNCVLDFANSIYDFVNNHPSINTTG